MATDCTPPMKVVCHNQRGLPEENAKIALDKISNNVRTVRAGHWSLRYRTIFPAVFQ